MSGLFDDDDLEDLTPPTQPSIGEEINSALVPAVKDMQQSNKDLATDLARSMKEAIENMPKSHEPHKQILEWDFEVNYTKLDGIYRPTNFKAKAVVK